MIVLDVRLAASLVGVKAGSGRLACSRNAFSDIIRCSARLCLVYLASVIGIDSAGVALFLKFILGCLAAVYNGKAQKKNFSSQ